MTNLDQIKSIIDNLRFYNDMPLNECRDLVDEVLDGEHEYTDAQCKEFLVNRIIVQLEHVVGV